MDVVVSALPEADNLGLSAKADGCVENGLLFVPFPIEDRQVPAHSAQFELFINQLLERARNAAARSSDVSPPIKVGLCRICRLDTGCELRYYL